MEIIKKIQEMQQEMTRWRQKLHAEPELAFEEHLTKRFLTRQLQSFGIEAEGLAKTGVIGVLHGKNGPASETGGKTIMLRADMDALPGNEESGVVHISRNAGVHHASGHDGHMAMLLGAAKYLAQSQDFDGTIYFVFQPAEEHDGGAKEMLRDGLLDKFPCDEVYSLRDYPELPLGMMASEAGKVMAASDEFHITLGGKGGHISLPEGTANLAGAMADIVSAINTLAQKEIPAEETAVMAVSSVRSDSSLATVLADKIQVKGTIRTYDTKLQDSLKKDLEKIVDNAAEKYGVTASVDFKNAYPALVNSADETDFALGVAKDVVGDDKVMTTVPRTLDVEDFACYLQEKPGNLMALGTGRADRKAVPSLYSAKYDFNDAALPIGASYWVKLVEKALPLFGKSAAPKGPAAPKL